MNKTSKVACSCCSCKHYKVPMYYIGSGYFQSHTCHFRYAYPCLKKKSMVKGTDKNRRIDVDSLRGMRNRNKYIDLDDKIKNLRSELTSLVKERPKMEARSTKLKARKSISGTSNSVTRQAVSRNHAGSVSSSGRRGDVNRPQGKQTKTKPDTQRGKDKEFTDWLDTTIDNLSGTAKSNGNKNKNIPAVKTITVEPEVDEEVEIIVTDSRTQTAAEELLYESFVVKNYPNYVPGSNGSAGNRPEPAKPVNSTKHKLGKPEADKNAKKAKTSDNKQSSEPKKQDKGKAAASTFQLSFDSDVEVIDIDDDSNLSSPLNNKVDDEDKHEVVYIKDDSEPFPEKEETPKEKSGSKKGPWECPICLEQNMGQEVVTTMCGHVFCKKCLDDYYVTHSRTCPTCRCDLLDKPVITLFNF